MAERDEQFAELPLDTPGVRLRRAREAAGLSLADISARTKIAERHLTSLETDNYGALASKAYAVGFARSYARTVNLDEKDVAASVREAMDYNTPAGERHQANSFEPGDPARVPSPRLAWLAGLVALAAVVAGLVYWRSYYVPAASLPELTSDPTPTPEAAATSMPATAANNAAAAPVGGDVVFTALEQGIWVKFYDGSGSQLMQKQMALGETYTVPAAANAPKIWTGRPDALQVTVGGRVVPKLAEKEGRIKDVPVSAAALLARPTGPSPLATPALPAAVTAPPVQSSTVSQ